MFQGSAHVPKNRHFELVERAGGSLNATTWFDRTNYFETLPSHHLDLALWLESDRMGWMLPAMDQEKLDNQRDVVKNEKRQRYDNQPYGDWDERLQALISPETHPYHHTVIGSMEDLDAATLDDVETFFRTYYVPNNAVLTVAGDFDPDDRPGDDRALVRRHPRGAPVPPIPGVAELPDTIGETVRERVVGDVPLPRMFVACRIPPYKDPRLLRRRGGAPPSWDGAGVAPVPHAGAGAAGGQGRWSPRVSPGDRGVHAPGLGHRLSRGGAGGPGRRSWSEIEGLADVDGGEVDRAVALAETHFVRTLEQVGERADLLSMFTTCFDDPERLNGEMERMRAVTPGRRALLRRRRAWAPTTGPS